MSQKIRTSYVLVLGYIALLVLVQVWPCFPRWWLMSWFCHYQLATPMSWHYSTLILDQLVIFTVFAPCLHLMSKPYSEKILYLLCALTWTEEPFNSRSCDLMYWHISNASLYIFLLHMQLLVCVLGKHEFDLHYKFLGRNKYIIVYTMHKFKSNFTHTVLSQYAHCSFCKSGANSDSYHYFLPFRPLSHVQKNGFKNFKRKVIHFSFGIFMYD